MSASQTFALCIDCWEFHYGISDSNGVYSRDSGSSNHFDHAVHVFGPPEGYPPPIRSVLISLHSGGPISDGRMELFSLACAITAVQPTNGRKVVGADLMGVPLPRTPRVHAAPEKPAEDAATLFEGLGA